MDEAEAKCEEPQIAPDKPNDQTNTFLSELLTSEEISSVPELIRNKIEVAVDKRVEDLLVGSALLQSSKNDLESRVKELEKNLTQNSAEFEETLAKYKDASESITKLEQLLQTAQDEAAKAMEECKTMRYEWQDFKTQRDLACDEKDSLLSMIDRRNCELQTLRAEKADLAKQLDSAVKAKLAAVENAQEVESLQISLVYKEKRLDQESSLLHSRINSLTEDLEEKTMELVELKRVTSTRAISAEADLAAKTEELRIALDTIEDLKESNETFSKKSEELLASLTSQRESYDVMMDNFHQELTAQTKLAQLYKDMCAENDTKTNKLTDSIQELRRLLAEASAKYGELETQHKEKVLMLNEEISKKNEAVQQLKRELQDANQLLEAAKQDNLDSAIGSLSPCAAAASRLIKSGMTLTQIYTQYARVSEELLLEKEENRRLNLYVSTIVSEIEEKAPLLQQQRRDYEKALASAESMSREMDRLISESQIISGECSEAKKTSNHLTRENKRLKKELADLARQVCYLVKAVEEARGGVVARDASSEAHGNSAQDIISKHLVTFATIEDLQENNQKLLALVRQLSEKQEAVESVSAQQYHELQTKNENLNGRVEGLLEEIERQTKMLDLMRSQGEMYKKLYQKAMGGGDVEMPDVDCPSSPASTRSAVNQSQEQQQKQQQAISELEKELKESKEKISLLEKKIEETSKKTRARDKELSEKIEKYKGEVKDWMFKNSKLTSQAEYNEQKCKILEANIQTVKKQVSALEDRNRTISEISAKHEQSVVLLKEQAMDAQSNLARVEVQRDSLHDQVAILKASEARLTKERESLHQERISNSLLMTNMDGLKATIERSEAEGRLRLETQLSEAVKECTALRSSLKDEKEQFKELARSLQRQTDTAKERMLREKEEADKAREDLNKARMELENKSKTIVELTNKLRDFANEPARTTIQTVTSNYDEATKRIKELEKQVATLEGERNKINIQLKSAQTSGQQYMEMATGAEKQLQTLVELHHNCSATLNEKEKEWATKIRELEAKLAAFTKENESLKKELESKPAPMPTPTLLVDSGDLEELKTSLEAAKAEKEHLKTEKAVMQAQIETQSHQLDEARDELKLQAEKLLDSENRYSQEVVEHSKAIQALDELQKKVANACAEEEKLLQERDTAVSSLADKTAAWEVYKEQKEKELAGMTKKLTQLEEQNQILHDTLQQLNQKLALLEASMMGREETSNVDTSLNTSAELSNAAQEELMKVIKFLRQEKNVATTKSEVLAAESTRLKGQLAVLQKQLEESNSAYQKLQETTKISESASAKHLDLLRKVESLNAVTDSNRMLREERNQLKDQVTELSAKLKALEERLSPVKDLNDKIESLTTDKQALTQELGRWKQRAAQLVERCKTSPEETRRLTAEKDGFQKQLQAEKASNEKLQEALIKMKQEHVALENQLVELRKQHQQETIAARKVNEELNASKQKLTQADQFMMTLRTQVTKLTEDIAKLTEESTSKESVITELRNKEAQIKRIAKKYKTQYEDLIKSNEEDKKKREEAEAKKPIVVPDQQQEKLRAEGRAQATAQLTAQITELEKKMADSREEMQGLLASAVDQAEALRKENDSIKKENEDFKTNITEKEDRAKQVIKTARLKIAQLTEKNNALEGEVSELRGQADLSRGESDSKLGTLKSNYEATIARLQKEKADQAEVANQERERLSNEIKTLTQRINQLQRSMDQPKPSTSSQPVQKPVNEPPTANIKPMAGSSSARKQTLPPTPQIVGPYWTTINETPFASIRPVQTRTMAVQPTSMSCGTGSGPSSIPVISPVLAVHQEAHTTAIAAPLSSSPTSSHTDYMPATSSAPPIRIVVPVPIAQSTQGAEEAVMENEPVGPAPQAIALVVPHVEEPASPSPAPSSTGSQASSSNTVTTTQAGHKRQRQDIEGDSSTSSEIQHAPKQQPQPKRLRVSGSGSLEVTYHPVSHSQGSEVEYQVPTSSQRDQEDDMVIMLDSEDEGNADELDVEEPDDGFEEDSGMGYVVEGYCPDGQDVLSYGEGADSNDNGDGADDGGSNEVEILDESNVPASVVSQNQQLLLHAAEPTSSGNDNPSHHVVVSHAASSQSFRTRSVPPLSRAQPSLQSYEESVDDSIVPSTPTLFLPRRSDVTSPQVPHQQRFTFSEPGTSRRDDGACDDAETGRSVPTTPLVPSPQDPGQDQVEQVPPSMPQEQGVADGGADEGIRVEELNEPETVTVEDSDGDGVTSEGERPPAMAGELIEEGREAEASEPVLRAVGTARRSVARRGLSSRRPTPIVWDPVAPSGSSSTSTTSARPATPGRGILRGRAATRRNWM